MICVRVIITDDREAAAAEMATQLPLSVEQILDAPAILLGSTDQIIATLQERRERFGVSNIVVLETVMEEFAPVVAALSGR